MKSLAFLFLLYLAFVYPLQSSAQIKKCLTYESLQQFQQKHPNAETAAQFEGWLNKRIAERKVQNSRTMGTYTIPLIFHIVHNGEAVGTGTNLKASLIAAQLAQLNADFANASGSAYSVAANAGIQFCLAVIGPDGKKLAEPGIERMNRNAKGWNTPPYDAVSESYVDDVIMPSTIWDPYKYMNVWVLNLGVELLGRASFPASSSLADMSYYEDDAHAGIILHSVSIGGKSMPNTLSNYYIGRTLTHEAGHFFGLHHIWGDREDCSGNDFCGDTPPQAGMTYGCPATGTLNGCATAVPKMFENYMDYTDDGCMNTFTKEQVTRMQTVMLNSPRRKELATAGTCTAPAANSIRFTAASAITTETASNTAACPKYKEIKLGINVLDGATGNATVQLVKSGTAADGVDYEIVPTTLSFATGDKATKNITIRIWDDGVNEATETLGLSFVITGNGVAAAVENQTFNLSIQDNDFSHFITSGPVRLLNENFGTSGGKLPAGWGAGSFLNPAGSNGWIVSSSGGIGFTGQSAHIAVNGTTANGYNTNSKSDVIMVTPLVKAAGYNNLKLSFKYKSNGEAYAENDMWDFGALMYSLNGNSFSFLPNAADNNNPYLFGGVPDVTSFDEQALPYFSNTNFYLGFRWMNDGSIGSGEGFTVDDIVLTAEGDRVGSEAAESGSQVVFAGQEVMIKSIDERAVMAKIKNPSAPIGCITATIVQAGTGKAAISSQYGSFLRSQKVLQLSPGTPNDAVTYEATLYFTKEELSDWGADISQLKILKVKDGVDLNSVLTTTNAQVVTPVFEDHSAEGYYSYTGSFKGFSQFMLVSPNFVLPVNLITFTARDDKDRIQLAWLTATETANKGFEVERSKDGVTFEKLGWVAGKGTTVGTADYGFTDFLVQPAQVYYYRLKQVDNDNSYHYSVIRQAKTAASPGLVVKLSPNPATDKVSVYLAGTNELANLQLLDAKGQMVGSWQNVKLFNSLFTIPLSHLTKGVYTLVIRLPDEIRTQKLIKQ